MKIMLKTKQTKSAGSGFFYYIQRIAIMLAAAAVFIPQFNPGRVTTEISKYTSLFTSCVSYDNLTMNLARAIKMNWVDKSTFILLMIASGITVIGVILCGIGGCMSLGNNLMRKKGVKMPIIGSVVIMAGLVLIYIAYTQIPGCARPEKVPANFSWGFYYYLILAFVILASSIVIVGKESGNELEDKMNMEEKYKLFLYFLPIAALAFVFSYLPLWGWRYAFFDYKAGGDLTMENFVGFKWFTYLFQNSATKKDIVRVLRNTLVMSGLGIATSWIPVAFAIFLSEIRSVHFRKSVQILTTIPNFISWVLVYAIAFAMFNSDGFINSIIETITGTNPGVNYLMDESGTWIKMLLWGMWKGVGWSAIVYIAAISGIDQQIYEAAMIDGAGRFKRMWYITVPSLMPTFCVMLMLSIANILSNGMEQYMVFENPLNKDKIEVLDYYVYNLGIDGGQIPLSTVVSMFKSVVSVVMLFIANKISQLVRGENII